MTESKNPDDEKTGNKQELEDIVIAIPVSNGLLSPHFGHCEQFMLFDIDKDRTTIIRRRELNPPPHEPGTYPPWLKEQGATVIVAGGMGSRAINLFRQYDIEVITGASSDEPVKIARDFLSGNLVRGSNTCDH